MRSAEGAVARRWPIRAWEASTAAALEDAAEHLVPGGEAVLVSHHVREATLALDELVGVVDVEEVLGKVFAGFCVGK